jgi:uncharacterized protein (TIGR01777 family)
MKTSKIIIAGGSGFIGEELCRYFSPHHDIVILSRQVHDADNNRNHHHLSLPDNARPVRIVYWDARNTGSWVNELDGADLLINLAGRTVNCRYTEANKKSILESRLQAVEVLGQAIASCKNPPALWINASSATIYRHAEDRPQDEFTGEFHPGFSVDVCQQWEKTFYAQSAPSTRKVALRMAITLGAGGVLIPYFNLLRFGLGGAQGSGRQMFSWVHSEDLARMIEWIATHPELEGTFNCCSPNPVTNAVFMKKLREATGHKFGLPAPAWMLRAGAAFIGTETELVLKSRWVVPTRILQTGFTFRYPELSDAFENIIAQVPRRQYHLF